MLAIATDTGAADFPLKIAASGRHLEDSAGTPFYFVGDTHWPLFWHYSFEEAREIIDDRAAESFTALLLSVAAFDNKPNTEDHPTFRSRVTLDVDEEYFAHADRVLDYAESRGLAVYAVVLWWSHYNRSGTEALAAYGRWLGQRWKSRDNLIWVIGGDDPFQKSDLPRFRALAEGIRAGGATQIMSWHPYGGLPWWSAGHSSSEYLNEEAWLSFSSVQAHAFGGRMVNRLLADYDRRPTRPTLLIESWYFWTEWRDPTLGFPIHQPALRIRQSLYQARVGGGSCGEAYGAWPFWYHSSTPAEWRDALDDQPAATQVATYMRRFFEKIEWWTLEPDRNGAILIGGRGWRWGWSRAVAGGARDRSFAVLYVPSGREIAVDLSWFSGPVEAKWYDPTNGRYSDAGAYRNDSAQNFATPSENEAGDDDFVLLIETRAAQPGAAPDAEQRA